MLSSRSAAGSICTGDNVGSQPVTVEVFVRAMTDTLKFNGQDFQNVEFIHGWTVHNSAVFAAELTAYRLWSECELA